MSKFKKKKSGGLPPVSTASLPDIVFMLLFFFMVTTVMRETTLLVQLSVPFADQVEKLKRKNLVSYIYAGKPHKRYSSVYGTEARIQLNDKFAKINDIQAYVLAERAARREEEIPFITTSIKADGETNMGLVTDIKQELREASALKINYSTKKGSALQNFN